MLLHFLFLHTQLCNLTWWTLTEEPQREIPLQKVSSVSHRSSQGKSLNIHATWNKASHLVMNSHLHAQAAVVTVWVTSCVCCVCVWCLQDLSQRGGWHVVRGLACVSQRHGDQRRLQLPEFSVLERVCSGPGSAASTRSCWSALTFFSTHTLPEKGIRFNILPHPPAELLPISPAWTRNSACLPNSHWFLQIQEGGEANCDFCTDFAWILQNKGNVLYFKWILQM